MEWWGAIFLSNADAAGLTSARDLTEIGGICQRKQKVWHAVMTKASNINNLTMQQDGYHTRPTAFLVENWTFIQWFDPPKKLLGLHLQI